MKRLWILLLAVALAFPALAVAASETRIIPAPTTLPSGATVGGGSGTDRGTLGGVIHVNTSAVGTSGSGAKTLMTYTLPPNTLDKDGRMLRIKVWFTASADNETKTVALLFGSTTLRTIAQAVISRDWSYEAIVVRTGPTSQEAWTETNPAQGISSGGAESGNRTAPAQDTGAAIVIKVNGTSAGAITNSVVQRGMIVEVMN